MVGEDHSDYKLLLHQHVHVAVTVICLLVECDHEPMDLLHKKPYGVKVGDGEGVFETEVQDDRGGGETMAKVTDRGEHLLWFELVGLGDLLEVDHDLQEKVVDFLLALGGNWSTFTHFAEFLSRHTRTSSLKH